MGVFRNICSAGFTLTTLLAFSTPINAIPTNGGALSKRGDVNCDQGPAGGWASPVYAIGGGGDADDGYNYHCETSFGHSYTPLTSIEVWTKSGGDHIAGLRFTYGDGSASQTYGLQDSSDTPAKTMTLAPGELISSAVLYGNGKGQWLGHIHLETNKQTFDAGRDTHNIDPYQINVGSGLLYGANIVTKGDGNNNVESIASLAWLFFAKKIDHIEVTDIKFTNDPAGTNSGISPQNVVVGQWYNGGENNAGFSLSPTYSVTQSYSYSQSVTLSFGGSVSVEVSGEIFGIGAKSDTSFTWGVSEEMGTTVGTTSATAVACVATGTLAPSQGVKVTGTYQTGKGIFDYKSTVTVFLEDGDKFTYEEDGKLENVAYNSCFTEFEKADDPTKPNSPGISAITNAPSSTTSSASSSSSTAASSSQPPYPTATGSSTASGTGVASTGFVGTGTRPAMMTGSVMTQAPASSSTFTA